MNVSMVTNRLQLKHASMCVFRGFGTNNNITKRQARKVGDKWIKDPPTEPHYGTYSGDHIYGVMPVRMALLAGRRDISELLCQEGSKASNKKDGEDVEAILAKCRDDAIPIKYISKHELNLISDNRPHQGLILRASALQMQAVKALEKCDENRCVVALDEITDPQNLGAILRTCHFLGVSQVTSLLTSFSNSQKCYITSDSDCDCPGCVVRQKLFAALPHC
jgi:tRNA G18 (ribose-2'-O)-methylase SpoU